MGRYKEFMPAQIKSSSVVEGQIVYFHNKSKRNSRVHNKTILREKSQEKMSEDEFLKSVETIIPNPL